MLGLLLYHNKAVKFLFSDSSPTRNVYQHGSSTKRLAQLIDIVARENLFLLIFSVYSTTTIRLVVSSLQHQRLPLTKSASHLCCSNAPKPICVLSFCLCLGVSQSRLIPQTGNQCSSDDVCECISNSREEYVLRSRNQRNGRSRMAPIGRSIISRLLLLPTS